MGLERVCSVLQDKPSNYDTDLFSPIFDAIFELSGLECKKPYGGLMGEEDEKNGRVDMAYRVIADHIRTLTFAITDGARPSNEGRGYVLRRILRRGVYYGKFMLNMPTGFFSKIVPAVVKNFKTSFPELVAKEAFVTEVILDEEESFARTIEKGMKYFNKIADLTQEKGMNVIDAGDVTYLYDTMGFPADLTQRMAEERSPPMTADMAGFEKQMEELREKSRAVKKGNTVSMTLESEQTVHLEKMGVDATDDSLKFLVPVDGSPYISEKDITVKAIYDGKGFIEAADKGATVGLVLDKTPYYAEQGGQVYDMGVVSNGADLNFRVENVKKFGKYVLHMGTVVEGAVQANMKVFAKVDSTRRAKIAPNHTGTHIMNYALRQVLGPEVDQKGSIVTSDKLRFDFNAKAMKPEEVAEVERIVNEQVEKDLQVNCKTVPLAKARAINTLRAVFGETYPDPVRVVSVGPKVDDLIADPDNEEWKGYSVELCGGTHITSSAQMQAFVIVEESGISKGVRRITALTRDAAFAAIEDGKILAERIENAKKMEGVALIEEEKQLVKAIDTSSISLPLKASLKKELKGITKSVIKFKKTLAKEAASKAKEAGKKLATDAKEAGTSVVIERIDFGADGKTARALMETLSKIHPTGAFLVISGNADGSGQGKVGCYARVPADFTTESGKALKANEWVGAALQVISGKGGGKADAAQGSGKTDSNEGIEACLAAAKAFL
jgi:alanyl-tRNA synthetase